MARAEGSKRHRPEWNHVEFVRWIPPYGAAARHHRPNPFGVERAYLLATPESQKDLVKMNHGFLAVPH